MRSVTNWLGPVLMLVVALAVVTWFVRRIEPRLAFFPFAGEDVTPQSHGVEYVPDTITTEDGERLRVWHLPRTDALAQVVYFHGNGGNL
ncbi:MAG: alpha/beta hydrolase, partial [Vicinamibacterales bacterium]